MQTYHDPYIRRAEIAQLILLHQLYMQRDSRALIFQGGTALRWCYGGNRLSENLDFVTTLTPQAVGCILQRVLPGVEKLRKVRTREGEKRWRACGFFASCRKGTLSLRFKHGPGETV